MSGLGLDSLLVEVREAILENPDSERIRAHVSAVLEKVRENSRIFQGYSVDEFIGLMHLSILGMGYSRHGISDLKVLTALTEVVPRDLGVASIFPVAEEGGGGRRLRYYYDVEGEVHNAKGTSGRTAACLILRDFGNYALFLSGMMPDILKGRRKIVDIPYYEWAGAAAFSNAASYAEDSFFAETLDVLASGFRRFRIVLNDAGSFIGTAAGQTIIDNMFERQGILHDYRAPDGPLKGSPPYSLN